MRFTYVTAVKTNEAYFLHMHASCILLPFLIVNMTLHGFVEDGFRKDVRALHGFVEDGFRKDVRANPFVPKKCVSLKSQEMNSIEYEFARYFF